MYFNRIVGNQSNVNMEFQRLTYFICKKKNKKNTLNI